MLRASAHINQQNINLRAVADRNVDPNIPAGSELLDFADALLDGEQSTLDNAREALQRVAGDDATTRAALVIGNFEMMNRLLDATGVPVPASMGAITNELGLPDFTGR